MLTISKARLRALLCASRDCLRLATSFLLFKTHLIAPTRLPRISTSTFSTLAETSLQLVIMLKICTLNCSERSNSSSWLAVSSLRSSRTIFKSESSRLTEVKSPRASRQSRMNPVMAILVFPTTPISARHEVVIDRGSMASLVAREEF